MVHEVVGMCHMCISHHGTSFDRQVAHGREMAVDGSFLVYALALALLAFCLKKEKRK